MSFDELPNHVILDIFKNVHAKELFRLRLVCPKWAEVVSDSIALRRNLKLVVKNATLNENHEFLKTFLRSPYNICTEIYFENVHFADTEMVTRLWDKIGANIECLRFAWWRDWISRKNLHQLYKTNFITFLKHTPNLREIAINSFLSSDDCPEYSESNLISCEFNLKKLRKVNVLCGDTLPTNYIVKILTKSAVRLTRIEFVGSYKEYDQLYPFIEVQRHSLAELVLNGSIKAEQMQKIFSIANLSLEVLGICSINGMDSEILQFLGNHRNLRELKCSFKSSESVQQLSTYLPKLEKLEIEKYADSQDADKPFPKNLNRLKSLKMWININEEDFTFETPTYCPALEVLDLRNFYCVKISSASLQSFIDNFPNLIILILLNCCIDSRNVAAICDKLVNLEKFNLSIFSADPYFDRNAFNNISKLSKLKELTVHNYIYFCDDTFFIEYLRLPALTSLIFGPPYNFRSEDVTDRGISGLIDNCPLLESLSLGKLDGVTEACLDEMVERLPHLRNISISGRSLANEKLQEVNVILENRIPYY